MRKKNILGSFVKNPNVHYTHSIKKLDSKTDEYSALITFLPGSKKLFADFDGQQVCIAGPGYSMLMYLPLNEYWSIVTAFSPEKELLEWYFDISNGNFIDENGMPCISDIYLDLVIQPNGKTITLDADELQEALDKNEITAKEYHHAYTIHDQIKNSKWSDVLFLTELSERLLADYDSR